MGYFGAYLGAGSSTTPTYPVIANAATAESIRDRIASVMESLTPTSLTSTKLRQHRNEGDALFEDWCEKNPAAAFRRFQIREVGDDEPPLVSSVTQEIVRVRYEIRGAYPQSHRYGPQNALDRDDVLNQDWVSINRAVGIYGRANFTGAYDCTPLPAVKTREQGAKVDYLVVTVEYEYIRSMTP
jgi:hypothetical protein